MLCSGVYPSPPPSEAHKTRLGGGGGHSWQYDGLHMQRGFPETQKTKGNSPYFSQSMAEPTMSRGKHIQTKNENKKFSQGKWCYGQPLSWSLWPSLWSRPEVLTGSGEWVGLGGEGEDWRKPGSCRAGQTHPEGRTPLGQTVRWAGKFSPCTRRVAFTGVSTGKRKRKEFSLVSAAPTHDGWRTKLTLHVWPEKLQARNFLSKDPSS